MIEIDEINHILKTTNIWNFSIYSYDLNQSDSLTIVGSMDLGYYHELEIRFQQVSYISLPTFFDEPLFRIATKEEISELRKLITIEPDEIVICIMTNAGFSFEKTPFYIVASNIEYTKGLVFYYERENLKENEKIAHWVKRS